MISLSFALRVIERQLCDHSVISHRKLDLRTLHLNLVIKHLYRDPMPLMHKNNENNNKINKKIPHLRGIVCGGVLSIG